MSVECLARLVYRLCELASRRGLATTAFGGLTSVGLIRPATSTSAVLRLRGVFDRCSLECVSESLTRVLDGVVAASGGRSLSFSFGGVRSLATSGDFNYK